ncbi:hypothetical protein MUK42_26817 [Musa troglodytarum]|uniref:Uncharacterized protein n=1 Tax=Musa troglodytarum TaxID=320322 RepID=A0A9E7JZD1_9LILI|nr:hypothetical protein MUK42_26817 [Musa troglodytarum]
MKHAEQEGPHKHHYLWLTLAVQQHISRTMRYTKDRFPASLIPISDPRFNVITKHVLEVSRSHVMSLDVEMEDERRGTGGWGNEIDPPGGGKATYQNGQPLVDVLAGKRILFVLLPNHRWALAVNAGGGQQNN